MAFGSGTTNDNGFLRFGVSNEDTSKSGNSGFTFGAAQKTEQQQTNQGKNSDGSGAPKPLFGSNPNPFASGFKFDQNEDRSTMVFGGDASSSVGSTQQQQEQKPFSFSSSQPQQASTTSGFGGFKFGGSSTPEVTPVQETTISSSSATTKTTEQPAADDRFAADPDTWECVCLIKNAGHREQCRQCAIPRQKIPVVRLNPEEHSQPIIFGNNSTTLQQQQPFSVSVPSSTTTTSAPTFSWGQTTQTKAETPKKDGFAVPTGLPSFGGFGATTTTNNASTSKPSISAGVSPVAASSSKSWMPSGLNTGNLFSFGSSPKPSLSNASSVDDLSVVDDKFSGVTSAFANATFTFTFESTKSQTPKTPSPTKNKWKTATSPTSPDYNPEDGEPNIEFSPLVTLSQLNHTSTGEENEVCLFVNRCKMFRYDATQWKERGLGELKILSNTRTGHRRLVMRRDQIHKLCANHAIVPGMEIKAMKGSTKAFVWQAYGDISDEVSKDMMLAARFKDETIANEFVAAVTEGFDEDQGTTLGSDGKVIMLL